MNCYPVQAKEIPGLLVFKKSKKVKRDSKIKEIASDSNSKMRLYLPLLFRNVEAAYGIPYGILTDTNKKTGRPAKVYQDLSLTEIRRALFLFIADEIDIPLMTAAAKLGIDHTSILKGARKGRDYLKNEDKTFIPYYNFVTAIAISYYAEIPGFKRKQKRRIGRPVLLHEKEQAEVIELIANGASAQKLSKTYGVSNRTIQYVVGRHKNAV